MESYIVIEWHGESPVKRHRVTIDPCAVGGRYRQLVSIQGFQSRIQRHTQRWDGERFLGYRNTDLRFHVTDRTDDDLPLVKYASLWDFYKSINYDHRTARLNGKPMQIKRS